MIADPEDDDGVYALPLARQKRQERLAERHAREVRDLEHVEKLATFIKDAIVHFLPEMSGKPIVDLTLSSPEAPFFKPGFRSAVRLLGHLVVTLSQTSVGRSTLCVRPPDL